MDLEELFAQTHRLPTVPQVAQELIESFNQENVDIEAVAKKVALDQVITAKVLRLANSAYFALNHPIGSVHEAVMSLGFNTVRTLVIATGITGAFSATPGLDRRRFWQHSLTVAAYGRWLAHQSKANADIAFTCGLLHNIGELLIHIVLPDTALKIDEFVASGADRYALETDKIGFDFIQAGEELARRWNFPQEIQQAIKYQRAPAEQVPIAPQTIILNLAARLAKLEGTPAEKMAALPEDLILHLQLNRAELAENLQQNTDLFAGLEELLN